MERKKALIVVDARGGMTATQQISFVQPFETADPCEFELRFAIDDDDAATAAKHIDDTAPDVILLSRYTAPSGLHWISHARGANVPVVFHIDDDLLAVPESLGASKFKAYNNPARLEALRANIEHSDLCYVSTIELGRRFAEHGVQTPIIPGKVYCSVLGDEVGALSPPATAPVIGYMGTGGHAADLAMILPAITELMTRIPELNFEIFGTIKMPPSLRLFGSRVRHIPPVTDYAEFRTFLRNLGWWIGLAPLEDNPFNRCKADTKWVEYSLAGMAVVASDLPVYQRGCSGGAGMLATSHHQWADAISTLLHRPQQRLEMIEAAQRRLRSEYSRGKLREQVVNIFETAMSTRKH